jgi:DNA-binding NarL/FixJ family response regulator
MTCKQVTEIEMERKVILLAEDEATIRSLVTISLKHNQFNVLQASDADQALRVARDHENIDLLLTDVQMQGSMNGVELAERLQTDRPGLPVLVMSGLPDSLVMAAEKGFPAIAKPFTPTTLTERVREVLDEEFRRNLRRSRNIGDDGMNAGSKSAPELEYESGADRLTSREQQVLVLVADGCTTKEIAARLEISFKTAACHRSRIMSKFGVHNSATLLRQPIRRGLIQA